jgi:hypothetical protein
MDLYGCIIIIIMGVKNNILLARNMLGLGAGNVWERF